MKTVGIILLVAGIILMAFRGFNFTQTKKVVDVGPLEINKKETKTVGWPIYVGGIITIAGVVILIMGNKKPE